MKRTLRWSLGLILTVGFTGVGQTVTAGSPETRLTLTIHVYNYAAVDDKTLAQAEQVAIGIFRKAGVEILWISENNQSGSVNHGAFTLSHIQLNILPSPMAAVLNLSNNVMGLAPGTGPNRHVIYVFYDRVEALSQKLATARREASRNYFAPFPIYPVATPQILGHAIAHELGHVLLNIEAHSKIGIMRGDWNSEDLQDIYFGFLIFTSQQAEIIRKKVTRRAREQGAPGGSELERRYDGTLDPDQNELLGSRSARCGDDRSRRERGAAMRSSGAVLGALSSCDRGIVGLTRSP